MTNGSLPAGAKEIAIKAAQDAGALLRSKLGQVDVEFKGKVDLVTAADRASEMLIAERLSSAYPHHRLVGEEGVARLSGADDSAEYAWIIDPLDGTTNFAHSYPHFAVSIALAHRGTVILGVVFDPNRDELFAAERGGGATLNGAPIRVSNIDQLIRSLLATGFSYAIDQRDDQLRLWCDMQARAQGVRRDGAAALNLCYVAAGRLDGFWEKPLQPWDMAAGSLIVEEAGGLISDYEGGAFDPFGNGVLAANGRLLEPIREIVAMYATEG